MIWVYWLPENIGGALIQRSLGDRPRLHRALVHMCDSEAVTSELRARTPFADQLSRFLWCEETELRACGFGIPKMLNLLRSDVCLA